MEFDLIPKNAFLVVVLAVSFSCKSLTFRFRTSFSPSISSTFFLNTDASCSFNSKSNLSSAGSSSSDMPSSFSGSGVSRLGLALRPTINWVLQKGFDFVIRVEALK